MSLGSGSRIGAYEILGRIGAGGMGELYRARHTRLNRDVAIRIPPEPFAADRDRVLRSAASRTKKGSGDLPGFTTASAAARTLLRLQHQRDS